MSEEKRYGDPVFGNTLADLKALTPLTQTIDGLRFEGPAQKVGAVLTLAAVAGDLIAEIERLNGTIEDLELALQDAEDRAESTGRNASAFEDRMGDLQVENGKLRDSIIARSNKLNEAQEIIDQLRSDSQQAGPVSRATRKRPGYLSQAFLDQAKAVGEQRLLDRSGTGAPEKAGPTCIECEGCGSRLTTNFDGSPVIEPCPCRNAKVEPPEVSAAKDDRPVGHPMQPIEFDGKGVVRFRENRIVRHLLDFAKPRGCGLNEIARMEFSQDDRMQLAQLIGYSVSGYGDLGYASDESVETADRIADELIATEKDN